MFSQKLAVCFVALTATTLLASPTVGPQERETISVKPVQAPAVPRPPATNEFNDFLRENQRQRFSYNVARSSQTLQEASPVQKAFRTLKDAETDREKATAETQLREALVSDYERKMDQYDEHIESLEKEIEDMKEKLSRRRAAKADMVDLKLKEMKANADGLGWPSNSNREGNVFPLPPKRFQFQSKPQQITPGDASK